MKEEAGQVLLLSDSYAPQMGPTQASQGEGGGVDLHASQAELAFTVIRDPVSATNRVIYLGADWRFCHVLTDGLWKRGRRRRSGIRRQRGGNWGSACSQAGIDLEYMNEWHKERDGHRPQFTQPISVFPILISTPGQAVP